MTDNKAKRAPRRRQEQAQDRLAQDQPAPQDQRQPEPGNPLDPRTGEYVGG